MRCAVVLVIMGCALVGGCSGHRDTSPAPVEGTGVLVVAVSWPEKAAVARPSEIPKGTASIVVELCSGTARFAHAVLEAGVHTATFEGVRAGTVVVKAYAYSGASGGGSVLAQGEVSVLVSPHGTHATAVEMAVVGNTAPTAVFEVSQEIGDAGTSFAFDASASADAETEDALLQLRWQWEAGGEWTEWGTARTAEHQYAAAGEYVVTLEVRDGGGMVGRALLSLTVREAAKTYTLKIDPTGSSVGIGVDDYLCVYINGQSVLPEGYAYYHVSQITLEARPQDVLRLEALDTQAYCSYLGPVTISDNGGHSAQLTAGSREECFDGATWQRRTFFDETFTIPF